MFWKHSPTASNTLSLPLWEFLKSGKAFRPLPCHVSSDLGVSGIQGISEQTQHPTALPRCHPHPPPSPSAPHLLTLCSSPTWGFLVSTASLNRPSTLLHSLGATLIPLPHLQPITYSPWAPTLNTNLGVSGIHSIPEQTQHPAALPRCHPHRQLFQLQTVQLRHLEALLRGAHQPAATVSHVIT